MTLNKVIKKPELRYFEVPVHDCGAGDYFE